MDSLDQHAVRGASGRTAVEVVLLDVDGVTGDSREGDVLVGNILDGARCAGVGLDAATVLAVDDLRVTEYHRIDGIVTLAADGADTQAVTAVTVHVIDCDVRSRRDSYAVILVADIDGLESNVVAGGDVETVAVVSRCFAAGSGVRCVASRVVQRQTRNQKVAGSTNIKAMHRPVLDVQVGYLAVIHLFDDYEVIRSEGWLASGHLLMEWCLLGRSAVGSQPIPVGRSIAFNDMARSTSDGDVRA